MAKKNKPELKTYVISAAQASFYENSKGDILPWGDGRVGKAKPHNKFLDGLENLSDQLDAELVIVPMAGKVIREDIFHPDLETRCDLFTGSRKRLNQNLELRDIVTPPQNVDPTTGKRRLIGQYGASLIFGHAKQRFAPVPVFNSEVPRYLFTTGAVTQPNYSSKNHRGNMAEREHVFGALVVEVIDDVFYNIRNVRALKNGKFTDLGTEFKGTKVSNISKLDTLVLGDLHWGDHDENAVKANYEMIDFFKPERIIIHDGFNGHSVNHHERDNNLRRVREFKRGRMSLDLELEQYHEELSKLSKFAGKKTQIYVVSSNHAAFLPRYINDLTWANKDIWNADIGAELYAAGLKLGLNEKEIDDASFLIEEGLKRHGKIPSNVNFLRLEDNLKRFGYQLASHGHKGGHGARGGGAKSREVTGGGRSITGHSHVMEVKGDTYIVGTSSQLDLPYIAGGGSAWIAANAALYKNGTVQMLPSINGKWKAKR